MDTTGLSVASGMEGISAIPNETIINAAAAGRRLLWTLNGPLESAIQVAPNEYYEPGDVMEPYFRPAAADDLAPNWHPVSQESMMEPQVSATRVRIDCIETWEELWVERFRYCVDTETDPRRPRSKHVQLEVTTSGEFLTVHEYVSAIHPWLMGMRETLLDVLGKNRGQPPWPPEMSLAVIHFSHGPLYINTEDRWAEAHKKPRVYDIVLSMAEQEEASRRTRDRHLARAAERIRELERQRLQQGNN